MFESILFVLDVLQMKSLGQEGNIFLFEERNLKSKWPLVIFI